MYMYAYDLLPFVDVATVDSTLLLCGAIHGVLHDPGFTVPPPLAKAAQETASALMTYCNSPESTPDLFGTFAMWLMTELSHCFVVKQTMKLQKEAMWGHFHQLYTIIFFKEMM